MGNTWQSRKWGAGELGAASTLEQAVSKLNPKAKQAMYAAANKGLIARQTWDGCAFNAGGIEVGHFISSVPVAASVFGLKAEVVSKFIQVWDGLSGSNSEATESLKEAILKAGLFSEPNESSGRRILRETVYKSYENRMKEQFEQMVDGLDLNEETEFVSEVQAVGQLLSTASF